MENNYSVNIVQQELLLGGKHSVFAKGKPEHSAHSWRKEMTAAVVLDVFYDPHDGEAKKIAEEWTKENDSIAGPRDIYSKFDRR